MEISEKDVEDFIKSVKLREEVWEKAEDLETAAFFSMCSTLIKRKADKEGLPMKKVAEWTRHALLLEEEK